MNPSYTPGPYSAHQTSGEEFLVLGFEHRTVCRVWGKRSNAERIAYCLNVVEQSEETARRDEGAQS